MAKKKTVNLSKLTFSELKDKVKDLEGLKSLNRFEVTQAVLKAENRPMDAETEKINPRQIKPEINSLKSQLAQTPKKDKKARQQLRREVAKLKRSTRQYL